MPRRTWEAIDYLERLKKLASAGLEKSPPPNRFLDEWDELPSLKARSEKLLGLVNNNGRKSTNMLFFVMYDIEDNRVRRYIVKYLEKQGCVRVQKSIFLADLDHAKYEQIKNNLADVQAVYENHDSILVVPISTDYLKAMKIIGQNINIDVITHSKNTLFF
ncbi:MAG: CRISPR-associated endonuclease Cas2 [Bacteroidales bacterium]|mgnify:CR=1 FL=1|nr:CRISPR-associated endonuclease Cas2 [Bacteroidales bacterium]